MVRFLEVTDEEFNKWRGPAVKSYAADKVRAGNDIEDGSLERAEQEFKSLLPDGRLTKNNYIYTIVDEKNGNSPVGLIWLCTESRNMPKNAGFIFDIEIAEEYRGKGYGSAALTLLEDKARELGKERISLHVFGHNERARKLYEELGYKITNIGMSKDLEKK